MLEEKVRPISISLPAMRAGLNKGTDMSNKQLKELNTQVVGWVPISYDFGRDEIFCEIEDDAIILSAAGLAVAGLALALAKDEDWISKKELLRVCIPGDSANKLEAAAALCSVGHWEPEQRDGVDGWRLGVTTALQQKRDRYNQAKNAALARHGKKSQNKTENDPFAM